MNRRIFLWLATTASVCLAQTGPLQRREWKVEGLDREALVYAPSAAKTTPTPLVFVFHGHGGNMNGAANSFRIHTIWPEAMVVYPQGLNAPGRISDPEGKRPGWQAGAGVLNDRDLKLFDVILATMRTEYKVDGKRIYSTGHSNGGGFTYLLWAHRGELLAAVAPSGAAAQPADRRLLKPKPVLHIAGRYDELVKFEWQEAMIGFLRNSNGSVPVETYVYDGGHAFPKDGGERIVAFFRGVK